jgi:hypothetical protein
MPVFPSFSERHPTFEKFGEITQESIALFKANAAPGLLADMLIEFWEEYGEGRFSDGLLYICDPLKKKPDLSFFLPKQDLYPIVISSFGAIYFTNLKEIFVLRSEYGWFKKLSGNLELLFEIPLQDKEYLDDGLDWSFHKEAIQKLGSLEPDQIFGFEPAIALGGSDDNINSVKKFQMDAHLAFLAQLVEVKER